MRRTGPAAGAGPGRPLLAAAALLLLAAVGPGADGQREFAKNSPARWTAQTVSERACGPLPSSRRGG